MSARYIALARISRSVELGDDWYPDPRKTLDVIVDDQGPRDTGLVDQHGVTIYRIPPRVKVGFG